MPASLARWRVATDVSVSGHVSASLARWRVAADVAVGSRRRRLVPRGRRLSDDVIHRKPDRLHVGDHHPLPVPDFRGDGDAQGPGMGNRGRRLVVHVFPRMHNK